jgi:outer membrane biosynthesis protein TonB
LDANERAAIDQYGLFNLNDYLPKQPSEAELGVIGQMFEASVDGQMYDPELWGNFYRPSGVQIDTSNSAPNTGSAPAPSPAPQPAPTPTPAPVAEAAPAPVTPPAQQEQVAETVAATAPEGDKPSAQDILAAIRNRNNG